MQTLVACLCIVVAGTVDRQAVAVEHRCILPEQRYIDVRPPHAIDHHALGSVPRPPTVTDQQPDREIIYLSLDEAIRKALANAEIIRVLSGTTAVSSGQSIYDPAVTNTQVDSAQAAFDPVFESRHNIGRTDTPRAIPGPFIEGIQTSSRSSTSEIAQTKPWGGRVSGGVTATETNPGALLDPARSSALDLGYTQPLLKGSGTAANLAPIVIARIDTERSFYQLKDAVQELVRSVIEGYWGIVFSRIDVWAREQQVEQFEETLKALEFQRETERANVGDTAQAAVSLANFRATLIASEAALLNREEALRNALGLPPGCNVRFVPSTPPTSDRTEHCWEDLIRTAHMHRPDIIETRLLLEADFQRVVLANNDALPQVDASASYQFNGLRGRDAGGAFAGSTFGQFGDWNLGLTMRLPLTLRADRAALRQAELVQARDRANLQQQLHATRHQVAQSLRNLEQFYEQYEAFKKVREASKANLEFQRASFRAGRVTILNLLQAVTDWGNAVSSEAQSLSSYNAELANLDRQIGVILEKHEIAFDEESYQSVGPCWPWKEDPCYPEAMRPTENLAVYIDSETAADDVFNLEPPVTKRGSQRSPKSDDPFDNDDTELDDDIRSVDELIEDYLKQLDGEGMPDPGFLERSLELPEQFSPQNQEAQQSDLEGEAPPTVDPRSRLTPLQIQERLRRAAPVVPAEPPK